MMIVQRSRAGTTWSRNSLVLHGVPAQAPSAHQPWLLATQSQNTAVQCGLDPAAQILSTPNFKVQCAWFQAASNHGCRCSAVLHLLLCVVKRQLIVCFKSSKPIQIGLCMLTSLSIHLHGLHLDAQCGQTYLSTQYAVERGLVVGFCGQPYYCYRPYYPRARFRSPSSYIWSLMNSSRTGLWTFRSHALSFPGTKLPIVTFVH